VVTVHLTSVHGTHKPYPINQIRNPLFSTPPFPSQFGEQFVRIRVTSFFFFQFIMDAQRALLDELMGAGASPFIAF